MNSNSILVVDDDPTNFDVIESLLAKQEYQLHYVDSGQQAIASLDIINPDLILLDIMMTNMNGIDVCQAIKAMPQWQSVPIIMVTALASKAILSQCLQAGADDFISKPIDSLELRARVHSMLRIKQQHNDLQALLQLRKDMVNIVVHDFRTPLSTIFFGLDTLTNFDHTQEQKEATLATMQYAGRRLQALTDEMLLMAKMEDANLRLDRIHIDISALISSVLSDLEGILAKRNLTVIREFSDSGDTIYADKAMLRRVVENLLANAIKFSSRDSKIILNISHLDEKGVQMTVADYGRGIPKEFHQKVFEKYETGTPVENVTQFGLGLAFCKMVIDAHGGTISVGSNEPHGSVFELILPHEGDG
ncbi:MAG: hybrid sensor histidine kinase/response regulator [Cyanobacteria bacterium P01_E01_bin.6]